ncbi:MULTISPECIES: ATP-dependent DNA helicase RecG [Pseudoalteromonas]|uniref:ATP-dependent DNA helicase RecG n=1 Tax=Pseudoalteromonas TaxID=53246 RepID=UPI0016047A7F|nr:MULTISPECIES: ATP-dependent DNA helicase RecG [unclassified Pseudoalteromonas]MBB1277190.1 ATP-dependent DNA helicase RecG [Pseudoalteromonas sp. SR43-3]MBB1281280.1 ATP-dependent DNA helicase RecG [Pseudoalteromonas sp. SR41-1]MBB1298518.1 ATP-dependent DNA helicase RecG [Pseudoalteromonas sp. SR41-7]MBB1326626.1 ATP-dependent DNA helicase RecG [Pseudoalteromonas sp. SR45-1]MBB1350673.1 ATP-dependent DNA helicase RecG [Pseudoalteromonas sp. SG45-3]
MSKPSLNQYPITELKGVGPKMAERLLKLGILTVQDMLFHLPLRYEDRTRLYAINELSLHSHVSVEATIETSQITFGKRRMLVCQINDGTGRLTLRFFNFTAAQKNAFSAGKIIRCFGEVRRGRVGFEMSHPEYSISDTSNEQPVATTLTPVYSTTEGLKQLSIRALSEQAIDLLNKYSVEELLPSQWQPSNMPLSDALLLLHRPPNNVDVAALEQGTHPAQQRLVFEELLAQNLSLLKVREQGQQVKAVALNPVNTLESQFLEQLPFAPTNAQSRVVAEIKGDMQHAYPMMRLVQGDVGSGKTLVAALSALTAIAQGFQVALMAPTEILSEQHGVNFTTWFNQLGITVAWLGGKTKGKERVATLEKIASGEAQMIVGTHALFQDEVKFNNLVLIVIDEQHRFGVHQRLSLREKGKFGDCYPHQLVMTATPIPRTLAMTAYADLETSVIDELPPGRTPITTVALPDTRRDDIIARVKLACNEQGRQVYWVCTLIDESEVLQCQAAEDSALQLKEALPELNVGLVHGRMKSAEKQAIMSEFKAGNIHVLVATTVIEVGVDVPNASLIIIENPERLGLAQLHQLRGRVGRGATASHCVLLYHAPLSHTAQKRLGVLRDSNDGFVIAERDLEIRGPGEVLGTKQTGLAEFKIADLTRDKHILNQVRPIAQQMLKQHPEVVDPLIQRWLGNKQNYAQA